MTAEGTSTKTAPHHAGHRDRLRQRFVDAGPEALADYELLELVLFRSIPRRDVKPLAKALLAQFGSLSAMANASLRQLCEVKGISERVAIDLKAVQALCQRGMKRELEDKPILSSWSAVMEYVHHAMHGLKHEQFRVLYLNKHHRLIADQIESEGTIDRAPAYPREIIRKALDRGATAIVLVHNHPSGDPTPSPADITLTENVVIAGQALGIKVHDHLIVGADGVISFKAQGLM